MIERIEGIVTDIVKYNDAHNVVTLYTRSRGRMAFLAPVGKSKTGRIRNATLSLMAVVGTSVNVKEGKEMYTLRSVEPLQLWHAIYRSPLKSSILFFIAEFCNRLLRQYPSDERLWSYLIESLNVLESASERDISNFHVTMLTGLLSVAGISPTPYEWKPGDRFDMLSGDMVTADHPDFLRRRLLLSEEESRLLPTLSRISYANMTKFRFRRDERQRLLDRLLEYYSIHLPIGREFKSLDVLRELFS